MDFRNRKLLIAIRTIFGLFMIFSGVSGFMALSDPTMANIPEPMRANTQMMWDTGIFQFIKVTEIVAGLMLVTGFLPALGAIFLAPICIGVIIVNALTAPAYVITGVIVSLFNGYLGYAYWDKYKALFTR